MRGLLCHLLPVTDEGLRRMAEWLGATRCEELLRGTSGTLVREQSYDGIDTDTRRAALVAGPQGDVIGVVHWWQLGPGVYEVGGAVGDERLWRTGIGLEAAILLVDYLFEVMNCRRVEFTAGIHNAATLTIGLDDAMVVEAVCRDYFPSPAGPLPAVKSGLTRDEYYGPYPHYQPRVGRRVDPAALTRTMRGLARRMVPTDIADNVRTANE